MGIDNIVETHLGFVGETPGVLMRKIYGETVEDWLIRKGFYEQTALSMSYTKEQLTQFMHSNNVNEKECFKQILRNAFETAIDKEDLQEDRQQLKCVDFITPVKNPGLCERMVSILHPEALEAFKERVAIAQSRWFLENDQGEINLKLGPGANVNPEGFVSNPESVGKRDQPVVGWTPTVVFFDRRVVDRSSPIPGNKCIIL